MTGARVLLILGGIYHDFSGFDAAMAPVIQAAGHTITSTYDLDELTRLASGHYDVILSYTSLSRHREGQNDTNPQTLTPEQTQGLTEWVRAGHGLVGVHAATVSAIPNPAMRALFGARFENHPPQFSFTVYPTHRGHPITAGVEAMVVKDEFYYQDCVPGLDVHMMAVDRGVAHPMVWTRAEGAGRVAGVAMGHDGRVWSLPAFQKLILQAIAWAAGQEEATA